MVTRLCLSVDRVPSTPPRSHVACGDECDQDMPPTDSTVIPAAAPATATATATKQYCVLFDEQMWPLVVVRNGWSSATTFVWEAADLTRRGYLGSGGRVLEVVLGRVASVKRIPVACSSRSELLGVVVNSSVTQPLVGFVKSRECGMADSAFFCNGGNWLRVTGKMNTAEASFISFAKNLIHFHYTYLHCNRCGSCCGTSSASTPNRVCQNLTCCAQHWLRTDPIVAALVLHPDKKRCLLVCNNQAGVHACVTGYLEPGETLEEGAAREVKEETGVALDDSTFTYCASMPLAPPFGSQLIVGFLVTAVSPQPESVEFNPKELVSAKWVSAESVANDLEVLWGTAAKTTKTAVQQLLIPGPNSITFSLLCSWLKNL